MIVRREGARVMRWVRRNVLAAALALSAAPTLAQTYNPVIDQSPDIGIVVPAAATPTTFTFSAATGAVTQSGGAVRRTVGATRVKVTINCTGGGSDCGRDMRVKVGPIGAPTGKAGTLTNFTVSAVSGTIPIQQGTNPLEFLISPQNKNTPPVFYLGADFPIEASNGPGASGPATSQFYVYVERSPTVPTTGVVGFASAVTYRGLSFEGTTLLDFGSVVRPASGSQTVTVSPSTGARTVTGGGGGGGSPKRASYLLKGEGGLAISISQDTGMTLNRTGGGGSIPVTLTHTPFPTALGGSVGFEGSASFYTGGSFTVTSATPMGEYTGSFSTTVNYN